MSFTSIKLKSGKISWEYVEDGPPNPVTGKRNQITRRGRTQGIAKRKVQDEIERQKNHGISKKVTKMMTFDKVAAEWLVGYAKTGKSKNTIRIRKQEIDVLNQRMAKVVIDELDHFVYQHVIYNIAVGLSRSTVQGINGSAGMIFRYAIRNKLMFDNPCIDVIIPKKRKTVEEIKENSIEDEYLEREEVEEFLTATLEHGLKYDKEKFYVLAFSGMRSGELCALQKSDLDFEKTLLISTKRYIMRKTI